MPVAWNMVTGDFEYVPDNPYKRILKQAGRATIKKLRSQLGPIGAGAAVGAAAALAENPSNSTNTTMAGYGKVRRLRSGKAARALGAPYGPRKRRMQVPRPIVATKAIKHFYASRANTAIGANNGNNALTHFTTATDVALGTGIDDRTGSSVFAQFFTIRGQFTLPDTVTGGGSAICRLVILQCVADSVVDSSINNSPFVNSSAEAVYAEKNPNTWFSYRTLYDKTWQAKRTITSAPTQIHFVKKMRCSGRVSFGAGASPQKNGILICFWGNNNNILFQMHSRFDFVDAD